MPAIRAKILVCRVLKFLAVLGAIYTVTAGVLSLFGGFADYTCFVAYDPVQDCVRTSRRAEQKLLPTTRVESFMTSFSVGVSGGGCSLRQSSSDQMELASVAGRINLERRGEDLFVNGAKLERDHEFRIRSSWHPNPWADAEASLRNIGLVSDCDALPPMKRIVVFGRSGTEGAPYKGLAILMVFLVALPLVNRKLRSLREEGAARIP